LVKINQEASANATTQEKSVDEVNQTVENEKVSKLKKNLWKSTSQHLKMLHTFERHKKPPVTKTDDFLSVDNNQILNNFSKDIYSLGIFHHVS
jgi:predicted nucleotide-binding protein (sugar kinase/HSP70/actin superfamily)